MSSDASAVASALDTASGNDVAPVEGLRDRGKRRRRERILECARELLGEGPAHSFTIQELAARAEVSIPTISNLIGNRDAIWAALADDAVGAIDYAALSHRDPRDRAQAIVAAMADAMTSDRVITRALMRDWSHGVGAMSLDPTKELMACFVAAHDGSVGAGGLVPRRLGEVVAAGLIGCLHQWGAGLISDRIMRRRLHDVVDVAFVALGAR
ncbi:TetR/AcrR family transcriptional regulator [Mycobacterium sp.]|jgi:AcrR family transcriptional regulator|uniref:TetR/AcrR family transcriptional regulator n=1 Tax=Mycobacterium sp. TaxID=1785 RepID=UPI002B6D41AA|nr:TetR family transcriptional regulator [Mycobacterium sp.]HXB89238.1 TetR family transcriptional regulator [Mycobacterium sp.]